MRPSKQHLLDLAREVGTLALELDTVYKKMKELKKENLQLKADNACLGRILQTKKRFEVRA